MNRTLFPYLSQRIPIYAKNCVATSQPLAAYAGLEALAKGGNAVDAALAAAITLTVVEPTSNSLGSDAFGIIWDGKCLHGINGSGKSPAALTPEHFKGKGYVPRRGWDCVTVPGAVGTWVALSKRFGCLAFEALFSRGIAYAKNGFLVSPRTAYLWQLAAGPLQKYPEFRQAFLPDGCAPEAGSQFKLKDQAHTLELIRDTCGEAFYSGKLAKAIVAQAKEQNGLLCEQDLSSFEIQWVKPISVRYREVEVFELPPNNGGITALIALAILGELDIARYPLDSLESVHLQIEAMKLAFVDSQRYIGDLRYMSITTDQLLARERIQALAQKISLKQAHKIGYRVIEQKGTVFISAADEKGQMVSLIQSHYETFGSGIVIRNTGIGLQNRGACFNLIPGHANEVGGSKYPYHTIMPGFVKIDGKALMSFGVVGGHMQPQGQLQVLSRIVDYGLNPQAALDGPRWHISPSFDIFLEPKFSQDLVLGLGALGHKVCTERQAPIFGVGQAIHCLEPGRYLAASDPRGDGLAVGF